jgi:hypothetical protein
VQTTVLEYGCDLAGIVVAAVVSSRVSVTVAGAFAAAAVVMAFALLVVVLLFVVTHPWSVRGSGPDTFWAMIPVLLFILTAPVLAYAGLLVAPQVVPGFDVRGAWGYVVLIVITYVISHVFGWNYKRAKPVSPESG